MVETIQVIEELRVALDLHFKKPRTSLPYGEYDGVIATFADHGTRVDTVIAKKVSGGTASIATIEHYIGRTNIRTTLTEILAAIASAKR